MPAVAALYNTTHQFEGALRELAAAGIDSRRVSLIASPTAAADVARLTSAAIPTGPAGAGGGGALIGTAAGGLVGLATLLIPGIGPVLAAGPLAAAIASAGTAVAAGAGVGAITGGLLGVLSGQRFTAATVQIYEERVAEGDLLVVIEDDDSALVQRAAEILASFGAAHVSQ